MALSGACADSALWREVRRRVGTWFEVCPDWAAPWTIHVRPKTAADDTILVEDGEAEAPAAYWAIYTNDEEFEVTVAVPPTSEADLSAVHAAGFLVELLVTIADPEDA